ncbi:MAG: hypothetical protein Q9Q13_09420 [Acidobacteriota bacterium]|nr:hypothetical protein [Acidobacteriota bacterium]
MNHYPNVILSTRNPLLVHEIFPKSITGVMGYGSWYRRRFGLLYNAYIGNGSGAFSTKNDDNESKAVGGHLSFDLSPNRAIDRLRLGISGYTDNPAEGPRTRTVGYDAQFAMGRFSLLSEYARRHSAENRSGLYIQPSWRFDNRWATYLRYDRLDVSGSGRRTEYTWGLNFRPQPLVSLKFEIYRAEVPDEPAFFGIAPSVAMAF